MNFLGKRINNDLRSPFIETKNNTRSPFINIEENINGKTKFAITKETEHGKYNLGGMLYFKLNEIEIYTEENNIIFVDLDNQRVIIREYEKVSLAISPENPEEKQYVVLYTEFGFDEESSEEFPLRWESYIGRKDTYNSIKTNLPLIDIDKSIVLVDNVPIKDALSIRQFIKYLQNAEYVNKEEIDIDEYSGSEIF